MLADTWMTTLQFDNSNLQDNFLSLKRASIIQNFSYNHIP